MEEEKEMELFGREWAGEYLEYYVRKYLEDYEETTGDSSEESDLSHVDWDFQKIGKVISSLLACSSSHIF